MEFVDRFNVLIDVVILFGVMVVGVLILIVIKVIVLFVYKLGKVEFKM